MNSILDVVLVPIASSLPQIAIAIVGLILIHTRLKPFYRRAYVHGTMGLSLLLANGLLGVATRAYIQANARNHDNAVAMANTVTMANFVGVVVLTAALLFILVALLADRSPDKGSRVAAVT